MTRPCHDIRRTARMAFGAVLLATALTSCTGGTTSASGTPTPPGPSASMPHPVDSSPPPAPVVRQRWTGTHTGEAVATAYAHGTLWVAFTGGPTPAGARSAPAGQLVKLDTSAGRSVPGPTVGGSPVAVAASASRIWVANDVGDGHPPAAGANTVQEFDANGALLHTYEVNAPVSVAVADTAAWVEYTQGSTGAIRRLHDGIADPAIGLPAAPTVGSRSLAVCGDGIYAATTEPAGATTTIRRIAVAGTGHDDVTVPGPAIRLSIACGSDRPIALVTSPDSSNLYQIPATGAAKPGQPTTPDRTGILAGGGAAVWFIGAASLTADTAEVSVLPPGSAVPGRPTALDANVAAADADPAGGTLYTVAPSPTQPGQYIITELQRSP